MSISPLVTVVITAYNSAKFLKWTLHSVQDQDLKNFEVLVVGDGCTDDTGEIVASFNDPRFFWKNLPHTVRSNAANQAIADSRGKYIAYLDHDDLWFPWHLSSLVECLESNEADFVFSLCASIGPRPLEQMRSQATAHWPAAQEGRGVFSSKAPALHLQNGVCSVPEGVVQNPEGPPFVSLENLRGRLPIPSTWLHRKDLMKECGPWRADLHNLRLPPDTELFLRIQRFQKKVYFCRSLSTLYFPSPLWLFNQRNENFPQEAYLMALQKDPKKLERDLLLNLTLHCAAQLPMPKNWPRWLVKLSHIYGQDSFPLFQFLRWRFLRGRKKWLAQKGLKL